MFLVLKLMFSILFAYDAAAVVNISNQIVLSNIQQVQVVDLRLNNSHPHIRYFTMIICRMFTMFYDILLQYIL